MIRVIFYVLLAICLTACATQRDDASDQSQSAYLNTELGLAYLQRGEVVMAKQKLLEARNTAPADPIILDAWAYYLEKTGQLTEAENYYSRALKSKQYQGDVENNYGTFLCRQKRYQEGIEHFIKATQDPAYLHLAFAYENAGLCAEQIPNPTQAVAFFKQAINIDPHRAESLLQLAKLSYNANNLELARVYLKRYLHLAHNPSQQAQTLAMQLRI